jgi:hypothetical protein
LAGLAALIGACASGIAIYTFVTGQTSLSNSDASFESECRSFIANLPAVSQTSENRDSNLQQWRENGQRAASFGEECAVLYRSNNPPPPCPPATDGGEVELLDNGVCFYPVRV